MARKGWTRLSPAYRARLRSAGVSRSDYESGASLKVARRGARGARSEGHGYEALLARLTGRGAADIATVVPQVERDAEGRYKAVTFAVTTLRGDRREYRFARPTEPRIRAIADRLKKGRVPLLPGYEGAGLFRRRRSKPPYTRRKPRRRRR